MPILGKAPGEALWVGLGLKAIRIRSRSGIEFPSLEGAGIADRWLEHLQSGQRVGTRNLITENGRLSGVSNWLLRLNTVLGGHH
jgi:hypothetical protein